VPRAVAVVALREQRVVLGESMPHISDEREPGGGLGRGGFEPRAVARMIDDRGELVRRNVLRESAQRGLERGARLHRRDGSRAKVLRTRDSSAAVRLTLPAMASRMRRAASG